MSLLLGTASRLPTDSGSKTEVTCQKPHLNVPLTTRSGYLPIFQLRFTMKLRPIGRIA